ncbi:MAG: sensor domain-containing diguanylate cyclase [Rhodoferax sp.]
MFRIDENETAWVTQYRATVTFVAVATAFLFASYAAVDWMVDPAHVELTWPWRVAGAIPCLVGVVFLRNPRWIRWAPPVIAFSAAFIAVVVSVIYLGILHHTDIALAAQMQVLMGVAVFGVLRTTVRATIPALLVSFNIGLWWNDAGWQMYALTNWLLTGAFVILLVVSETAYRTFLNLRLLEQERQRQAIIVQSSEDAIIGSDLDGRVTSWNAGAQRLFGYTAAEMLGRPLQTLVPPALGAHATSVQERVERGEPVKHFETVRLCKEQTLKDVSVSISPLHDAHGAVIGSSMIARDISERKRVERSLHEKDAMFRTAIETTSDGFWSVDPTGKLVDANQAYARLSGYTRAELLTLRIADLEESMGESEVARRMEETMRSGSLGFETTHRRKDGTVWPVEVVVAYSPISGGLFFVFTKDLTDRKRTEELTWHQANFDNLTDLPNRALLFDRLSKECALARRNNSGVALLFADLDGFKRVNDQFGHDAGDQVLREVARRWLACVREADTVARLGGDEFAIVLGGMQESSAAAIAGMAEKIIASLVPEIQLASGATCRVGVSIGISIYPGDAPEVDTLLNLADAAMYESKARGKNSFTFCNKTLIPPIQEPVN